MSVEIKEVKSRKELKQYVKFGIDLYKGNPYHVPSLIEEEMMTLDPQKNPAFEVCEAVSYLAYKEGKIVGRITGMINRPSNETASGLSTLSTTTRWSTRCSKRSRRGHAKRGWKRSTAPWASPIWTTRVC